jgi:hypothetical protein
MAAKAELANQTLLALISVLYEADTDGRLANTDPAGGRVLVPLPWGGMGAKKWGLRASEARALRWIMFQRAAAINPAPLLDYDAGGRHWYVSLSNYPSRRAALGYFQQDPITVDEWRTAWRSTRTTWAAKQMGAE